MPEVANRGADELQRMVRELAEESAGEMAAMRKELEALRRDAAALTLGRGFFFPFQRHSRHPIVV